jgi:hypothetical protein
LIGAGGDDERDHDRDREDGQERRNVRSDHLEPGDQRGEERGGADPDRDDHPARSHNSESSLRRKKPGALGDSVWILYRVGRFIQRPP